LIRTSRFRALTTAALAALVILTTQPAAPAAAETPLPAAPPPAPAPAVVAPTAPPSPTPAPVDPPAAAIPAGATAPVASVARPAPLAPKADLVIAIAMAERGSPWVYGATGPRAFDCSGLVTYAFRRAGVLALIGSGRNRGGSSMLRWARARHFTRTVGHRGDIVVWGNGAHVGIYLGKGRAISTLTSGVRVHGLRVLNTRFTTFISTGLSGPGRAPGGAAAAKSTSVAQAALAAARAKVVARRTVTVARLNLRNAPSLTAGTARVLARGTDLGVLRSATDGAGRTWYRVVVGARIGWVAGWLTRPAA
jgi:cell wall-associated NlpC family hydrolase